MKDVHKINSSDEEYEKLKDFFKKRADSKYDNENNEKKQIENILSELKSLKEEIHKQELECQKLNTNIKDLGTYWEKKEEEHQNVLRLLIRSDMDAIKSFTNAPITILIDDCRNRTLG